MNFKELFISLALIFILTIVYVLLRKFIYWTIKDEQKFHKQVGALGKDLDEQQRRSLADMPIFKLTMGYILLVLLVIIYIVKLFADAF